MYEQVDGVAMGSPLGPILANIFMAHIEKVSLENFTGSKPTMYCRYVDDIFLVFKCRTDMECYFDWLNTQHANLKFTKEEESCNQLAFLDVLVTRTDDGHLVTSVYRKPTFSGLYLGWDSFVPKQYKRGLVCGLIHRAWRICSDYEKFHSEILFLKNVLACNGYPTSFVEGCLNKFLMKQHSPKEAVPFGPERKTVMLCLPFTGAACDILRRQLTRMLGKIAPCIKVLIIFKPVCKLSVLSKLKCSFPLLSNNNVVYKVDCTQCNEFYIGMTTRRLEQRMMEHAESSTSALYQHYSTCKHTINFQEPKILARASCKYGLMIKEALLIKECKAYLSLNRNVGSADLKLF